MIAIPGITLEQAQRVLIVDDEPVNLKLLETLLATDGHLVTRAESGEDALAAVIADPPDLVLLDVMMPGMDGYQVARAIKNDIATRNIPIIMITALADRESRIRGLEAGAEDFLNKPVDRAELQARVKNLLRLKAYSDYYGQYSEMLERTVALRTADLAERTNSLERIAAELRQSEAQQRQSQKMEAVGQLAGGVAHDFNNLLTIIMSYSDLVIHDLPNGDEHHHDMEQVISAAKSAAALTRQLLAFSRKQILKPSTVNLNELVTDMMDMLGRLIGTSIQLAPVLVGDIGNVRADRGQLEQVLMNLVVNARDAMPNGGQLQIETANVEIGPASFVALTVCDTGIGMDEKTKEKLFEPFFTTKPVGKGTGLGLATVYGIVQQSGGLVEVLSAPGKGSTFKVLLPRTDS